MRTRYLYLIAFLAFVLDQLSKYLVTQNYALGISSPVVHNAFHITLWRNNGGAFGIMQSWPGMLAVISAIAAVGIIAMLKSKTPFPAIAGVALALQLGGALGNLIDRVRLGYVVDFIDLIVWPIFNVADIAITVGVILLAYHLIFGSRKDQNALGES